MFTHAIQHNPIGTLPHESMTATADAVVKILRTTSVTIRVPGMNTRDRFSSSATWSGFGGRERNIPTKRGGEGKRYPPLSEAIRLPGACARAETADGCTGQEPSVSEEQEASHWFAGWLTLTSTPAECHA
jgi:hypothetical protein